MRIAKLTIVPLLLAVLSGCQSPSSSAMNSTAPAMAAGTQRAILITGKNGDTTIFIPSDDAKKPVMMSTNSAAACSECKAAAVKYFETGVLEPTCQTCGGKRTLLVPATPHFGHQ